MIAVRTKLPARLDENWPGLRCICRIERRRETRTLCSRQVIYAITSIPEDRMNASALLKLARDHWQIENRLFHVRDRTFLEDACRVRSDQAPAALAHLRDAALTIIRRIGSDIRDVREAFAASPRRTIRAVIAA